MLWWSRPLRKLMRGPEAGRWGLAIHRSAEMSAVSVATLQKELVKDNVSLDPSDPRFSPGGEVKE